MHICGIIAEYDPFHTGHAHQIQAVREYLGAGCAVVCIMSGNWTQRGAPAITDKHTRARLALMGGADLVLELPLPYAISSAEWFARGGVSALNATGVITHLCFGSECGVLEPLQKTATCLDSEAYRQTLHVYLDQGLSFPVARQEAAQQLIGDAADCLSTPNNNLGVEYLRALRHCNSPITPFTIPRQGAGYGEPPRGGFASATYIRSLIHQGRVNDALPFLIDCEVDILSTASISSYLLAERAVLYALRQLTAEELSRLPDCGEGLANRLYNAIRQSTSIDEILSLSKTKRYTLARLRRILLWAFLGLSESDRPSAPPYLRVLGLNQTGRKVLKEMTAKSALPLLTKPAHILNLSVDAQRLFALESRATDLYGLCLEQIPSCDAEWKCSPVVL